MTAREELEQLRATQTRLGHAELAQAEAERSVQARQDKAASLREALAASQVTIAQARLELAAGERAHGAAGQQRQRAGHREVDAATWGHPSRRPR